MNVIQVPRRDCMVRFTFHVRVCVRACVHADMRACVQIPIGIVQLFPRFLLCFLGKTK